MDEREATSRLADETLAAEPSFGDDRGDTTCSSERVSSVDQNHTSQDRPQVDWRSKLRAEFLGDDDEASTDVATKATLYKFSPECISDPWTPLGLRHYLKIQKFEELCESGSDRNVFNVIIIEDPDSRWIEAVVKNGFDPTFTARFMKFRFRTSDQLGGQLSDASARMTCAVQTTQRGTRRSARGLVMGGQLEESLFGRASWPYPPDSFSGPHIGSFEVVLHKVMREHSRVAHRLEFEIPIMKFDASGSAGIKAYILAMLGVLRTSSKWKDCLFLKKLLQDQQFAKLHKCLILGTLVDSFQAIQNWATATVYGAAARRYDIPRNALSRWHEARQDVVSLRGHMAEFALRWAREKPDSTVPTTDATTEAQQYADELSTTIATVKDDLSREADRLEEFLRDLGQVLIGTISLQDSARSTELAEQSNSLATQANSLARSANILAQRATWLTLIAAVYLPLTLVTGIFGMNIKEINGGTPEWWACITAFALIGTPSIAAAIWVFMNDRRMEAREKKDIDDSEAEEEETS